jgi:hypothetical protein
MTLTLLSLRGLKPDIFPAYATEPLTVCAVNANRYNQNSYMAALFFYLACESDQASFEDREWKHGAFAKCLIDELTELMKEGRVTTGKLADRLKQKVERLVERSNRRDRQRPHFFLTDSFDLQMTKPTPN